MNIIIPINLPLCSNLIHDIVTIKFAYELSFHSKVFVIYSGKVNEKEIEEYYNISIHSNLVFIPTFRVKIYKPIKLSISKISKNHIYFRIKKLIKDNDLFYIYSNDDSLNKYLLKLKKLFSNTVKLIHEAHDIAKNVGEYKDFDFITCTTYALKNEWQQMHVNSSQLDVLQLSPNIETLKETIYTNKGELKNLIYAGKLFRERGVFTILDSLKFLKSDFILFLFGGRKEDILKIKKYILDNKINQKVVFFGFLSISELIKELETLKGIFIVPPLYSERYNYIAHTKASDGLAIGQVMVASKMDSIEEVLEDNGNLLFESGNSKELALSIEKLSEMPLNDLNNIVAKNLKKSIELSFKNRVKKFFNIIKKI